MTFELLAILFLGTTAAFSTYLSYKWKAVAYSQREQLDMLRVISVEFQALSVAISAQIAKAMKALDDGGFSDASKLLETVVCDKAEMSEEMDRARKAMTKPRK